MKRLIVCADGTWNTPDQRHDGVPVPTNVRRFFHALSDRDGDGRVQQKYYHPGVGTEGNWLKRTLGGALGKGLAENVQSAYHWLCWNYEPGDEIALIGFSRGAYTVRALAGMMGKCQLLNPKAEELGAGEFWRRVKAAFETGYKDFTPPPQGFARWPRHENSSTVHFLGVWDTVGAYGIPNQLGLANLLDNLPEIRFVDHVLGSHVQVARHAVAIDEKRANFTPTLWDEDPQRIKQLWFPGVHSDVGGGYPETDLSDGALQWMAQEAAQAGFLCRPEMIPDQVTQDGFQGVLHDSFVSPFNKLGALPRPLPRLTEDNHAQVHASARKRQHDPPITLGPYRPTTILAPDSAPWTAPIYARDPWNETDLYLEAGVQYRFQAEGEWLDKNDKAGPNGLYKGNGKGGLIHRLAAGIGKLRGVWRKILRNPDAEIRISKRVPDQPWFALIGVLANAGNPQSDGTSVPPEQFLIGEGTTYRPQRSGYLRAFANDSLMTYGNNRGSVRLTVTRLA